ncbi:expressed unknown protein [Seminavis robusta]|uniref:Uncharacterized protein n=1 Tax=Seminavis robusta TaxID=568900 RepID=A0A9N8HLK0_9STRA|nr:expressed unknown protein [Seminavis robusta]|eukprot:Sro689_g187540.1 n/a (541) ;mRNA; r:43447-45175
MSNETDTPGVTDINSRSANVMTTRKDTGGAPPVATLNGTLQRMAEERAAKEAARATVDRSNVITGSGINIPGAVLERSQKKRQKETSMHTNTSEEIVKPAPTATTGTGTATSTAIATKTRGLKRSAEEKAAKDAARLGTLNSAAATVGASAVLPSPPATTAHQRGLKQRSEKENDAKQAAIGTAISATSPAIAMVNPSKGTKGNMDVASLQPGAQFVTVTPASDSIRSTAAERLSTTTMRGLAKNRKSNVSSVQTAAMVAAENNTPGSFKTETVASVGLDGEGVGTTIISSEDSTTKAPPTGSGTAAKIVTNQTGRPQVDTDADLENQNQRMKESLQDITNVGLVEARAVAEASASQYFQEAQQVDDAELEQQADKAERERQKKEKERQCRRIGYAVMLVSLAIIAISLGVGLRPQKPGNTQTMGPQEKAREWLQNHPNYDQLSDWKKNQLLALATFFYAMQGEHWPDTIESDFGIVRRDRWLDYTKDECLWYSRQSGPPVLAKEDHDSTLNSGLTDLPSPCNELELTWVTTASKFHWPS